jgi:hypothetical protein
VTGKLQWRIPAKRVDGLLSQWKVVKDILELEISGEEEFEVLIKVSWLGGGVISDGHLVMRKRGFLYYGLEIRPVYC